VQLREDCCPDFKEGPNIFKILRGVGYCERSVRERGDLPLRVLESRAPLVMKLRRASHEHLYHDKDSWAKLKPEVRWNVRVGMEATAKEVQDVSAW
jgi:hypothetical protein